jgi:hypothetical protein
MKFKRGDRVKIINPYAAKNKEPATGTITKVEEKPDQWGTYWVYYIDDENDDFDSWIMTDHLEKVQ